jgi:hypothetical protein
MSEDTPDLSIGPFRLWVLGREFPDAQDFWDGNWLNVIADCELNRARVEIEGPYLHLSELETWRDELEEIDRTLSGTASVGHIEPNLRVVVQALSQSEKACSSRSAATESPFFLAVAFWIERELSR